MRASTYYSGRTQRGRQSITATVVCVVMEVQRVRISEMVDGSVVPAARALFIVREFCVCLAQMFLIGV